MPMRCTVARQLAASATPRRLGLGSSYVLAYNLLQFCGHSWVLANVLARAFRFGPGKTTAFPLPAAGFGAFIAPFFSPRRRPGGHLPRSGPGCQPVPAALHPGAVPHR